MTLPVAGLTILRDVRCCLACMVPFAVGEAPYEWWQHAELGTVFICVPCYRAWCAHGVVPMKCWAFSRFLACGERMKRGGRP